MNMKTTKTNDNSKGFGKTKLKVNKMQNYVKTEGHKADYGPSTANRNTLALNLSFCSSAASTVMLGRSFHS